MFSSDIQLWHLIIVVFLGIAAAFINSVAGGGSILSLPFMIFTGMPTVMAHGTNRFGLIFGSFASYKFLKSKGHLTGTAIKSAIVPVAIGTLCGTMLAVSIPSRIFNGILAVAILIIPFKLRFSEEVSKFPDSLDQNYPRPHSFILFFLVGLYGGFIQVGTGLIMMYVFSRHANLTIYQVNALKSAMAFVILLIPLVAFIGIGMIHWPLAVSFAIGSYAGGKLGAWWQLEKGLFWIKWFVRIMGCVMAVKLIQQLF